MSHWRDKGRRAYVPHEFSMICKMESYGDSHYVDFVLPRKFASATDARIFAEGWNPNPSFRGTITTMSVCRSEFVEDKLKRYRDPPAKPRVLTLAETEKL